LLNVQKTKTLNYSVVTHSCANTLILGIMSAKIYCWWYDDGQILAYCYWPPTSLLIEYCWDTVILNKCSEIGFWSPVQCPVFFLQMSCKMSCILVVSESCTGTSVLSCRSQV